MYAEALIEILRKLPPGTNICKTSGENGCDWLDSAKYFPQYDILYLETCWGRKSKGYIDMGYGDSMLFGQESRCPYSKEELREIRDLAKEGKKFVDDKKDGKQHRIQVVAHTIEKSNPFDDDGRGFSLLVDNEWVGGLNSDNMKEIVCDFEWESLIPGVEKEE